MKCPDSVTLCCTLLAIDKQQHERNITNLGESQYTIIVFKKKLFSGVADYVWYFVLLSAVFGYILLIILNTHTEGVHFLFAELINERFIFGRI